MTTNAQTVTIGDGGKSDRAKRLAASMAALLLWKRPAPKAETWSAKRREGSALSPRPATPVKPREGTSVEAQAIRLQLENASTGRTTNIKKLRRKVRLAMASPEKRLAMSSRITRRNLAGATRRLHELERSAA